MANQFKQEAEIQAEIDKIKSSKIDRKSKLTMIKSLKQSSFSDEKKQSTFATAMSISNTMVGTSILVFPILYYNSGIFTAMLLSFIMAFISAKTTDLLLVHNKKDELDFPDTLIRILGGRWRKLMSYTTLGMLWSAGIIYMILIINQLYPLLTLILKAMNISVADQNDITFSTFSYQWTGIGYMCLIFPILIQKNLKLILKFVSYGTISVVCFIIFTIYKGIENIINQPQAIKSDLKLFTFDFITLAGVFCLALLIQPLVIPICKNNMKQTENGKAVIIGYGWTWFVYQVTGVFGALAICGIKQKPGTLGSTIFDFFASDSIPVIIVQFLLLLQLTTVFPVLQFVARSQFIGLIHETEYSQKTFYGFTLFYSLSCLLIQCLNIDLALIISISGALVGLIQEFLVPIKMHLSCLYTDKTQIEIDRKRQQIQRESKEKLFDSDNYLENPDYSQLAPDQKDLECNNHDKILERVPKTARYIIYGALLCLGFAISISKLVTMFI